MRVPPLLVIVGPTASGKTRLGVEVAEALDGEVVSADAFAVYRGLDIGTDKPDPATRRRVRHHLVDIADPRDRFSAGDFVRVADAAIRDIRDRGLTPVVAGGTHFYVRALLHGLFPLPERDPRVRSGLDREWDRDREGLLRRLAAADPEAAARIAPADRQRVLRALEVFETTGVPLSSHWRRQRKGPRYRGLLAAPLRPRAELYARIDRRVDTMFSSGLVDEVRCLLASGVPTTAHAFKAIGYREVVGHMEGLWDLSTAVSRAKQASRHLAKRQLSWLRNLAEGPLEVVAPAEEGGAADLLRLWDHHLKEGENA